MAIGTNIRTLPKAERLCGKKAIATLMEKGRWGSAGCLRYCWLPQMARPDASDEVLGGSSAGVAEGSVEGAGGKAREKTVSRIMVSVPKKHFKRAVKRNLLKRRIREAYRLNKNLLGGAAVDILFYYNSRELCTFGEIETALTAALQELNSRARQEQQH